MLTCVLSSHYLKCMTWIAKYVLVMVVNQHSGAYALQIRSYTLNLATSICQQAAYFRFMSKPVIRKQANVAHTGSAGVQHHQQHNMASAVAWRVQAIRKGNYPVVVNNHTLILNWNSQTVPLLRQIAINKAEQGGAAYAG